MQRTIIAALLVLFGVASCATQTPPSGNALYAANCASCHGRYADGTGPASADIVVPDLRYIAADNGGVFPRTEVSNVIDGRLPVKAHFARQMPVWGNTFASMEPPSKSSEAQVQAKIDALVDYLAAIQQRR